METPQSQIKDAVTEKRPTTERSESEMDTEGGKEASTSTESQSREKKGHVMSIYFTDLDEEAIVDFVKDHRSFTTKPTRTLRTMPG